MYAVMVIAERFFPPLEAPNVQVTSMFEPFTVAVPIVGACGTVVTATDVDGDVGLVPKPLYAVPETEYVPLLPTVNVTGDDVDV
jgi:hypothetical protein